MEARHAVNHVTPSVISTDTDYNLIIVLIIFSFKKLSLRIGEISSSAPVSPSTFPVSWINFFFFFFLKLIFGVTNWDGEIEGKKDKDITALTDSSHMKVALLCLLATLCRKRGTKKMKRREK